MKFALCSNKPKEVIMELCITHIHTADSAVEAYGKSDALMALKSLRDNVVFVKSNDHQFEMELQRYLKEVV